MKKSQAMAYIRQLCCLGLSREALAAELLRAVQAVIPSSGNIYGEFGKDRLYGTMIPEYVVPEAMECFATQTDRLITPDMQRNVMRWYANHPLLEDPRIMNDQFYSGDFYNLVWRPCHHHHTLQCLIPQSNGFMGTLLLARPRSAPGFSSADKAMLLRLTPYLEHGMQATPQAEADPAGSGESGMFVMDAQGKLVFSSGKATELLMLAKRPAYPVGTSARVFGEIEIPPALLRLCRNLEGIFRGKDAEPPMLVHDNARGRFVFRAQWLDPVMGEAQGLIGVTVEHREPAALRLLRCIGELPLSPGQMEVCLLLAQSHSHESIGQRLNIKLSTVKDHTRKIYDKLGIRQREELLGRLAGEAA